MPEFAEDWRPSIVKMVLAKQALAAVDVDGVFPFHYPKIAAPLAAIEALEGERGFRLDAEHRAFLTFADGWPAFFHSVDLFGTSQLAGDEARTAEELLAELPDALFEGLGSARESLLPIAASAVDTDVFVMPIADGAVQPGVIWLAGEEVDRFESFGSFFESMIQYNLDTIEDLKAMQA